MHPTSENDPARALGEGGRVIYRRAKLSELHTDPSNARRHDARNLEAIAGSLKAFGQVEPLVVQRSTGRVIGGNGRLEVMRRQGATECDIVEVDVSDTQAAALGIALNRSAELAEWDDQTLARLLESLPGDALAATGFDDTDLRELLDKLAPAEVLEVEAPEPPEVPVSRRGDLWVLGGHRLLCGDSTSAGDVRRLMAGEAARLLFCDPPYGVAYQTKLSLEEAVARRRRRDGLEVANDALSPEQTLELVRGALGNARDAMAPGAGFYVCSPSGDMSEVIRQAVREAGLGYRQVLIWAKDVFVMGRQDYHWRHEDLLYGWKEGAGHYFVDDRTQDTVWEIARPKRSEQHPTMKPVELVARAVANSSRPGELVLDVFLGSGTTLIAAEQLGRRCYGLEYEPRYTDVVVSRWEALTGGRACLDGDGRSFGEVARERLAASETAPSNGAEGEAA